MHWQVARRFCFSSGPHLAMWRLLGALSRKPRKHLQSGIGLPSRVALALIRTKGCSGLQQIRADVWLSELRCGASGPGDGSRRGARSARPIQRRHLPVRKHHKGGSCGWEGGEARQAFPIYLFRRRSKDVPCLFLLRLLYFALLTTITQARKQPSKHARLDGHVQSRSWHRIPCCPCSSVGLIEVTRPLWA